ncbi:hypothetical protein WME90_06345 [Sorangium sp. So ce375]|uniref:hypothetical protein n=1 Tax=Sorangium sp. So ce375 TaxID=3133306 RepID=UPI003F5C75BD
MATSKSCFLILGPMFAAILSTSCAPADQELGSEGVQAASSPLTAHDRLVACDGDPRVIAGLVSREVCAGADIFLRETFEGNGRTCGSCHPATNNFTIDGPFISSLPSSDPLFVFEYDPNLATLETADLRPLGLILENVDGTDDLANKFTLRSVPHTLSMATSITPDPVDGTATPPVHRTGWSGDGAPGSGSLRDFLAGAVKQHLPTDLSRQAGVSFRAPTEDELDLALDYQLTLGRSNELDLTTVALTDAQAEDGRVAYLDPARGRCNLCHRNAGANDQGSGLNRNSDTGTRKVPVTTLIGRFDGGFGGQGLATPNIDVLGEGALTGFGDGTFNPPPLIEAADTAPFFHTNSASTLEQAITFYNSEEFEESPAAQELEGVFGGPVAMSETDIVKIGRFLRVLNAAFNLDIANQRLQAAHQLVDQFHNTRVDVQQGLLKMARIEIDDALEVLSGANTYGSTLHGIAQVRLLLAKTEIAAALSATSWSTRRTKISTAITRVQSARGQFGTNIAFQLGEGNLMY